MKKKLIIGFVITTLFITYFIRVYYVNATSDKIEKIEYEIGQTVEHDEFLYTVKSTKILNVDELNQEFNLKVKNSLYNINYIVTEIEMEYMGEDASVQNRLINATFQSGAWHNGQAVDILFQINESNMKMEKGKKYTLYTAGMLGEIMFLKDDWKKVKDMKFELVLSTYPKEIVLKCN